MTTVRTRGRERALTRNLWGSSRLAANPQPYKLPSVHPAPKHRIGDNPKLSGAYISLVVATLICGAAFALLVFLPTVKSTSMSPTLKPGEHVVVVRTCPLRPFCPAVLTPALRREDIVILQSPDGTTQLVKRIVAVGGDRVHVQNGLLFLNGKAVYEPYAYYSSAKQRDHDRWPDSISGEGPAEDVVIPPDMIFVLGDNRGEALDSRRWGPLPQSDAIGKVVLRFPLEGR